VAPAEGDRHIGAVERPAVAHDRQHVADPRLFQHGAKVRVLGLDLITTDLVGGPASAPYRRCDAAYSGAFKEMRQKR
jgi:hypothetical protein